MQLSKGLCQALVTTCKRGPQAERPKYTKSNLPNKVCLVCGRPFEWRKKWEKVWEEVKYCSERCRRQRQKGGAAPAEQPE